jgi:CelD/BcsL family acetyltransferase involved in cellulose biosynthesis
MYQINVKPISDLETNQQIYLDLFNASQTPAFFAHPVYLLSWWKHLGKGEAKLLTISHEDKTVGYLVLYKADNKSPWRLVGAKEESDYLDLVCAPEHAEAAWQAVLKYLQDNKSEWGSMVLECIPDASQTKHILETTAATFGFSPTIEQQDVSPVIILPTSWEEYLESIDSNLRKRIKRFTQTIQEDDVLSFKTVTEATEIKALMPDFIALHKASGEEKASFWTPKREAFFLNMLPTIAKHGLVKIEVLEVSNDPAAMVVSFIYQNRLLGYNSGFNQYRYGHMGVGTVLAAHSIEEAIKAGYTHYDFMRGNETYKFEFGAVAESVWDVTLT